MKTCKNCNILKPEKDFHKHHLCKDGIHGICKICHREMAIKSMPNYGSRECERCGKEYKPKAKNQKYCGNCPKESLKSVLYENQEDGKECSSCNEYKLKDEFYKDASHADGYKNQCKECVLKYKKGYYQETKEEKQEYYKNNKDRIIETYKKWHKDNYEKATGEVRVCNCCGEMYWCEVNQKSHKTYCGDVCADIKRKEHRRKRENRRAKEDPVYRLDRNMRTAIWNALKRGKAGRNWNKLIGYSIEDLKNHLESNFQDGMTWDNYGEWHIDHIVPKSFFNYRTSDDLGFKECWALSNLQPLWADENMAKRDNYAGQLKIGAFNG